MLLYDSLRQSETDAGSLSWCVSQIKGLVYERLLSARAVVSDLYPELCPVLGEPRA